MAAGAHGVAATPNELGPNLSEKQLRAVETQMLGPEHAAEHAAIRARARAQAANPAAAAAAARAAVPKALVSGPPSLIGQWDAPFPIPIFGINAVMLPTGKVMWWSYPLSPAARTNTSEAWLWDPSTGATTKVNPPLGQDINGDGQPCCPTGARRSWPDTTRPAPGRKPRRSRYSPPAPT
jgi:hypothetical protein